METEPCEEFDPAAKPTKPEVEEAITEPADDDTHTELPCGSAEEGQELHGEEQAEAESCAGESQSSDIRKPSDPEQCGDTACKEQRKLQTTNSWKTVRFQEPSMDDDVLEIDSSAEKDRLLRKKLVKSGAPDALIPVWGQEVSVKMQCVLEDRTVVEKDTKLVFVIGEGDVNQALEECVMSMQKREITLLLADSQCAYGLLGR
ncbi:hypothetical protein JOQ06_002181 [Pogonophryne albipinna]|uniref:peptidylprolyl isomerase n=1 Tax=Pogonophryne albipinna TaxID=1090488 RepID=A0AAD6FJF4_9TELE|nr:hypothetical protein JOQ06_002181 [Pogonophryne albipinna]